jgi:type II secretory pathway component PulF
MGVFSYRGINREGKEVKGVIEAPSKSAAFSTLKKKGIFPYEIVEEELRKASKLSIPSFLRRKKIPNNQELIVFLRTLSTLLRAGIPIVEAVESFGESEESKHLKVFFKKVASLLKEGSSLSEALKEAGINDKVILSLVESGEKSALLPENLLTAAEIIERREELKNKLLQALIYPLILLTVAVGVVSFMMTVVIPKIVVIYQTAKLSLPTSTKIVIETSQVIREHYWLIIGALALSTALLLFTSRRKRKHYDRLKLKLPLFGKLLLNLELQRFLETVGRLLKAGLPLIEAVNTAVGTVKNEFLRGEILRSLEEVKKGGSLSQSLEGISGVPKVVIQLIRAGEKAGNLDQMCIKSSLFLKNETDYKIKTLTSLIEPVTMLLLGLIIGFIVYALLLPIVSISTIRAV